MASRGDRTGAPSERRAASRRAADARREGPPRRPPARRRLRLTARGRIVLAIVVVGVLGLAALGAFLLRPYDERLPDGVTIGGVEVGGLQEDEARALLRTRAQELVAGGLTLQVGSEKGRIDLRKVGVRAQIGKAIEAARADRTVVDRARDRLGLEPELDIPLRFTVDEDRLERALRPFARKVEQQVQPAEVRKTAGGRLRVVAGKAGIGMDRKLLLQAVSDLPRVSQPLQLELRRIEPDASTDSAREAKAAAETLLETEHELALGASRVPLPRGVLADALTFATEDGVLRMRLERPKLGAFMRRTFGRNEVEPRNARFRVDGDQIRIDPSQIGRIADEGEVAGALERNPGLATVPVAVVDKPPTFSTADAQKLGVTDLVAEFETPYAPGEPRVTNIQRASSLLDGTILAPGETFNLNERLGQRTVERGFVLAPMIDEGRLKDDVGGGVSQVATMLFNGAFLSGLELIEHTPHSFYIARYPAGREATVSWGGPELIFRNSWDAPIVISLQAFDDHIEVRFFSRMLGREVEYGADEPTDIVEAEERKVFNPALEPGEKKTVQKGGQAGFTIRYWRRVRKNGKLIADEEWKWAYRPEDTIFEVGPDIPDEPATTEEQPTDEQPPPDDPPPTDEPPATSEEPPATDAGATDAAVAVRRVRRG